MVEAKTFSFLLHFSVNSFFPMQSCLTFGQLPKFEALKAKLNEFNGQVAAGCGLTEHQLERFYQLANAGQSDIINPSRCSFCESLRKYL